MRCLCVVLVAGGLAALEQPALVQPPRPHGDWSVAQAYDTYGAYRDLRFGGQILGSGRSISYFGSEDSGDWDGQGRLWFQFLMSPGLDPEGGGAIFGLGFDYDRGEGPAFGDDFTVFSMYTMSLHGGWGYPFNRNFQLELLPFLGLSLADYTYQSDVYTGFGVQLGVNTNLVYIDDSGLQIGLMTGFMYYSATVSGSSATDEFEISAATWTAGGFVGLRF